MFLVVYFAAKVMYVAVDPNGNQDDARGYTVDLDGNQLEEWGFAGSVRRSVSVYLYVCTFSHDPVSP